MITNLDLKLGVGWEANNSLTLKKYHVMKCYIGPWTWTVFGTT